MPWRGIGVVVLAVAVEVAVVLVKMAVAAMLGVVAAAAGKMGVVMMIIGVVVTRGLRRVKNAEVSTCLVVAQSSCAGLNT